MTIVVGGYIIGYPLGGMTWHHLNYVLGLHEMGHEVWFFEYGIAEPYNPVKRICEWDATFGTNYLAQQFKEYGLPPRWCYQSSSQIINMTRDELRDLFARADLMICVSGITPLEPIDPRPRKMLVIDTDPVFTQINMSSNRALLDYYKQFDVCATFGKLIGTKDCSLPTHSVDWFPTNQPIAMNHWTAQPCSSHSFTTIGKWEQAADRHVEFQGQIYRSNKSVEWQKVIDLPKRTDWKMTLGMAAMPKDAAREFCAHGWNLADPEAAAPDCNAFQRFIANSAGEFTVAKQIYSQIPSGWFSDRSAAYLASGRPVVTQETGFGHWLPLGEGLHSFQTIEQAADALRQIAANYPRHSRAAREIAQTHFDSRRVLDELLGHVL